MFLAVQRQCSDAFFCQFCMLCSPHLKSTILITPLYCEASDPILLNFSVYHMDEEMRPHLILLFLFAAFNHFGSLEVSTWDAWEQMIVKGSILLLDEL